MLNYLDIAATKRLQPFLLIGHCMLGDFDACLRICLDNIHRNVAAGQAPGSGDIRMIGHCL